MSGLRDLLKALPDAAEPEKGLVARGSLVTGEAGLLRLLLRDAYLDVEVEDVVALLPMSADFSGTAVPVEACLRPGAAIRGLGPADAFRFFADRGGIPFAVRCRPPERAHRVSVEKRRRTFHERERRFLTRYGLR